MSAEPFIVAKKFMFAKVESARGTKATTFAATDRDVRLYGIELEPELDMHMREYATGRHSKMAAIPGKSGATVKFKHDFVVATDLVTVPPSDKFMLACGQDYQSVLDIDTMIHRYLPVHTYDVGDTLTIAVLYVAANGTDAVAAIIKGAMGNCVLSCDGVGHKPVMDFTFKGALVGIGTWDDLYPGVSIPTEDYVPAAPCSTYKGAAVTQDGTDVYFGKFSFDFGNTVEMLEVCKDGEPTGYEAAYISKREPKLSWDNLARLDAVDPSTGNWQDGVEFAVQINTNKVDCSYDDGGAHDALAFLRVDFPKAQIMTQKTGDMKGALSWDRDVELHEDAGNDAHTLSIRAVVEPYGVSFTDNGPLSYASSGAITPNDGSHNGTQAGTAWTVSPALPAGLSINSGTGIISGTPTTPTAAADYTVTATNEAGTGTRVLNIEIT